MLTKRRNVSAVQFEEVVLVKTVRCGNIYPGKRMKEVFMDGLLTVICNEVRIFCGSKLRARLTNLAQ